MRHAKKSYASLDSFELRNKFDLLEEGGGEAIAAGVFLL